MLGATVRPLKWITALLHNDQGHRVAASDVEFRVGPDGNSGSLCCYAAHHMRFFKDATSDQCAFWRLCEAVRMPRQSMKGVFVEVAADSIGMAPIIGHTE